MPCEITPPDIALSRIAFRDDTCDALRRLQLGYLEGWQYEIAAYRLDKLIGLGMVLLGVPVYQLVFARHAIRDIEADAPPSVEVSATGVETT